MNVKFIFFLVLMVWSLETFLTAKNEVCSEGIVDIGFIMDSSGSLGKNYKNEKDLLKTLASLFSIKPNGSQAGVITFSFYTEHSIKLNQFSDQDSFDDAVDRIPLMGHTTRIDKGLRLAQKEMFKVENGGRPGVSKLLVLLTDGSQTQGKGVVDPAIIANEIRKEGIPIIAIGIGSDIDKTELAKIGGGEANTYSADTFEKLKESDFIQNLKKGVCVTALELPNESITDLDASTKLSRSFGMDIVFAMDTSSSSSKEILQKQKSLIRSLTKYLLPSSSNQLGLVTYSNKGHVNADLSSEFNVMILDEIENTDKRQNVDSGIRVASDMIFKPRNKDEKLKNRSKVLVLFVTGKQSINNPPFVTENYEKLLQDDNVQTLVIAFDESEDNFNKNLHGSNLLQYTQEKKTENSVKSYLMGLHENAEGRSFNTDVVFAMDLSSSSGDILQKQKRIVRSLTEYLLPSKSNELGLVTYSDIGNIDSELSPKFNSDILDKIENNGRKQNVAAAITVASENIFTKRNNDEKLKKKQRVLVLFVVGKPSSSYPPVVPERYGKLLEENNVKTIIIGLDDVGEDFNKNIPGSKLSKYSENGTANELKGFVQGLHDGAEGRAFNVDMVFAMDLSSSSDEILQKQKKAIRSLIEYHLPSKSNELGLITYSDVANVNSELTSKFSNDILDKIENNGRKQNVAAAITVASEKIFTKRNNDEKLKKKQRVLVLFVVGKPSSSYPPVVPERYGKLLEENNVKTIIIGLDDVGEDFNKNIPGSKLSKYSENGTANELKGFVQGLHDGGSSNISNINQSIHSSSNTTSGINQSTIKKGSNLTEGHCIKVNLHPLDKDIQIALNLLQSGMDKDWIVKFLQNTDSLEMILKYHKNLRHILSEFQPSLHRLGVFPEFDCKSKAVEKTLTSIFNYNEKANILSKARDIGGGKFVDMLWATGLANEILNSNEDITLIVPLSISNIPDSIDIKKNSACSLVQMLKYHMVVGKNYVTNLKNNDILKSMNNAAIIYFNKFDQLSTLSGSVINKIVLYNIEALGGVIHVVDNFMLPPDRDIISLLEKRNNFTIFAKALKESMLLSELKNSPHTYFVVDDTNINKGYISELNSSEKISNFVRRHTVPGLHFSHMLHNNAILTAVDGSTVKIHHGGDKITVNGFPISTLDLISHSGIVHVIDNPL